MILIRSFSFFTFGLFVLAPFSAIANPNFYRCKPHESDLVSTVKVNVYISQNGRDFSLELFSHDAKEPVSSFYADIDSSNWTEEKESGYLTIVSTKDETSANGADHVPNEVLFKMWMEKDGTPNRTSLLSTDGQVYRLNCLWDPAGPTAL